MSKYLTQNIKTCLRRVNAFAMLWLNVNGVGDVALNKSKSYPCSKTINPQTVSLSLDVQQNYIIFSNVSKPQLLFGGTLKNLNAFLLRFEKIQ